MHEVWLLDGMKVFDAFKVMASEARAESENYRLKRSRRTRAYPILYRLPNEKGSHLSFMPCSADFSKSEKRLLKEFKAWLRLPGNNQRLAMNKRQAIGTGGE